MPPIAHKKNDDFFICNHPSCPPIHTDYLWNGARTWNYARVLSLGLNISTRAEVTYPPLSALEIHFFWVERRQIVGNMSYAQNLKIISRTIDLSINAPHHPAHHDQRGLKTLNPLSFWLTFSNGATNATRILPRSYSGKLVRGIHVS